jgi:hypothetical protein
MSLGPATPFRFSSVQDGATGPAGPPGAAGPAGAPGPFDPGPWVLAMDLDLTSYANQTFATDTTYTYAGMIWTKYRSALETLALKQVVGTGLVITPATSTGYSGTAIFMPRMHLPLANIPGLANVAHHWPLRLSANFSIATVDSSYGAVCAFSTIEDGSNNVRAFYSAYKGVVTNFSGGIASNAGTLHQGTYTDAAAFAAYNSLVVSLAEGVGGGQSALFATAYSAGWPTDPNLFMYTSLLQDGLMGGNAGLISNWGLDLGAFTTALATTVTFTRLRVEYLPR